MVRWRLLLAAGYSWSTGPLGAKVAKEAAAVMKPRDRKKDGDGTR